MSENIFEVSPEVTRNLSGIDPLNRLRAEAQIARMRNQAQTETLDMRDRQAQSDVAQRRRDDIIASPTVGESTAGARRLGELDPTADDYLEQRRVFARENPQLLTTPEVQAMDGAARDEFIMAQRKRDEQDAEERARKRQEEEETRRWSNSRREDAARQARAIIANDPQQAELFRGLVEGNMELLLKEALENEIEPDMAEIRARAYEDASVDLQQDAINRNRWLELRGLGLTNDEIEEITGSNYENAEISDLQYFDALEKAQEKQLTRAGEHDKHLTSQGYTRREKDFYPPESPLDQITKLINALTAELKDATEVYDEERTASLKKEIAELNKERADMYRAARRSGAGQGGDPTERYRDPAESTSSPE